MNTQPSITQEAEAVATKAGESVCDLIRQHWSQLEDIAERAGKRKSSASLKLTFDRVRDGEVEVIAKISYSAKHADERVDVVDTDSEQAKLFERSEKMKGAKQ